ncbi:MAG TPA: DUF2309 domain-containing protein [Chloroflexia bacterium]|nr:DUF2309 domain-containing protein [Chloroflexia bacterium]
MATKLADFAPQEQLDLAKYLDECVEVASRIIAPYWPINTFIANNGLGGLENLPFSEAVKLAGDLRKSQGFLPLTAYKELFSQGRITEADLDVVIASALQEEDLPEVITQNGHNISTRDLYKAWLLQSETPETVRQDNFGLWQAISNRLKALNLPLAPVDITSSTQTLSDLTRTKNGQTVTELINQRMIRWCSAFLDEGQAAWSMPGRDAGFYKCWKDLAGMDNSFRSKVTRAIRQKLAALPGEAEDTLIALLQELEIPASAWSAYLTRHLAQLPGWASLIRWREENPQYSWQQQYPITLVEYLAVRLFYEVVLVKAASSGKQARKDQEFKPVRLQGFAQNKVESTGILEQSSRDTIARMVSLALALKMKPADCGVLSKETLERWLTLAEGCTLEKQQMLWQEAYEWNYRSQLMLNLSLERSKPSELARHKTPAAQAVFCIDVRSEGLRRHLESLGAYETFGFAGFFGVPMLYRPFGSNNSLTLGPALITVTQQVNEVPKQVEPETIKRYEEFNSWRSTSGSLVHTLKENLLTPFAFVEMTGWFSLFPLVGKTLLPKQWRKLKTSMQAKIAPTFPTEPSFITNPQELSVVEQARSVGNMLRSIGLTGQFARFVLLCGHGSETENNPYASSLDCGACGGNHGGNSAYVAATILNSRPVRHQLAKQGLNIAEETFFLAGEHNTTTDEVAILNEHDLPAGHRADFELFKKDLEVAGTRNATERLNQLPGATANKAPQGVKQRAADWAQVRPEWGLVRNAAFICGRRSLTAGFSLDNRVFLHSYDQNQDQDGSVLEGILTAPVVVAEWINMQYYLSTVDNYNFGSGTKLLHSVVGQVGVIQGQQSDLLLGLPKQSVMLGDQLYHEPLRLCVIVEATPSKISPIIARHEKLQDLTRNKWITLVAYDSAANTFYQYTPGNEWHEIEPETLKDEEAAA